MNAEIALVYEQFIEMGFEEYDEYILSHPDYPETDKHENMVSFEDDVITMDVDDNLTQFIVDKLKPAVLHYYAAGPFFGYEDFKLEFVNWGITEGYIVYCTLKDTTIYMFENNVEVCYDIVKRTHWTDHENDHDNLQDMIYDIDGSYKLYVAEEIIQINDNVLRRMPKTDTPSDYDERLEHNLKNIGFVKHTKEEFKHVDFATTEESNNTLQILHGEPVVCNLSDELKNYILEKCRGYAQREVIRKLHVISAYKLEIGEWRSGRCGLVADIKCTYIPLFQTCLAEYNIMSNNLTLWINNKNRYYELDHYLTAETFLTTILPMISEHILRPTNAAARHPPAQPQ